MKIVAGSLSNVAETFLHPGYISANPRPIDPYIYETSGETIELGEALRLTGDALASAGGVGDGAVAAASTAASGSWPLMLAGALTVLGLLATTYLNRREVKDSHRGALWRGLAPVAAGAMALMVFVHCNEPEQLPETIPWEGVELQEYENPELATRAILHGLIADAIINVGQPIDSLANLGDEVALPTAQPTDGMAYALQTYGIDGWGNEMELLAMGGNTYQVTSAGHDGQLSTSDDLIINVSQTSDSEYDYSRAAFFLRRDGDDHYVLFHRWNGSFFRYNNEETAEALTGSNRFDAWTADNLNDDQLEAVRDLCQAEAERIGHEPLLLQLPADV